MLAAFLLPLALLPLGRLVPTLGMQAAPLAGPATAAAGQVAALLARQSEALRRIEATSGDMPHEALTARLAADPALQGARLREAPAGPGSRPALLTGRRLQADPDPAALAAALGGALPAAGAGLMLLGPDGQVLTRAGDRPAASVPFVAVEYPVEGWPLRVLATRAAPPASGMLPLGAAMLALLLLALLAYRREQHARIAALAGERRDALRAAALAESEAQLRLALSAAELGCWSWDEAADRITWDAQAAAILGWRPTGPVGMAALRDRMEPADLPLLDAAMDRARRSGEPAQCALRLRVAPGTAPRWIELRSQAAAGPGGTTWHGVIAEITERRRAEEQQRLLLREVDHRAKNTLAVVQALLRLTRTEDPAGFLPRVEARIAALARAHTLLAQSRWQGAGLRRLLEAELGRHRVGGTAPSLSGPPVMLAAIAAQPMAMVLHELASNAARFGALAQPGGRLSLAWRVEPGGGLELAWQERLAGPPAGGPAPGGLGTRILDTTVRDQLGGRITRDWTPDGLHCVIHLPPNCILATPLEAAA